MNTYLRRFLTTSTIAIGLPAVALGQSPANADHPIDTHASTVAFTVSARLVFPIRREARFHEFAGQVAYDPQRPGDTRVDLTVYTASVDTSNREHDALLRSADFFDTGRFPTMRFVSTGASVGVDGALSMAGELTIRGITRRLVVPVRLRRADRPGSDGAFDTDFQIDRTDFGLTGGESAGGLKISIARIVQIHLRIAARMTGLSPARLE